MPDVREELIEVGVRAYFGDRWWDQLPQGHLSRQRCPVHMGRALDATIPLALARNEPLVRLQERQATIADLIARAEHNLAARSGSYVDWAAVRWWLIQMLTAAQADLDSLDHGELIYITKPGVP
jgi:hypothetical protein